MTVLIGTITGSILGFWSCRVLCKGWFQRKINESPTLQAFMHTMESKGFYLILIMRMAPIPFGVQNGLFSVLPPASFHHPTTHDDTHTTHSRAHTRSAVCRYRTCPCCRSPWPPLWAWSQRF